nr:hypothetical protein [Tanacetum cinerariifolium]
MVNPTFSKVNHARLRSQMIETGILCLATTSFRYNFSSFSRGSVSLIGAKIVDLALPPSDYVPGLEEPEQAPPSPVYIPYVLKLVYPEYIHESYLDEDPKEDDDEDPEEDPADYPADHDDDEEEEEPSGDDADEEDEEQDEDDDDEEEEHPASADSIPPPPALRVTARVSFRPQLPTLSFTKEDAERFLAMPIPSPSPLTPLSSLLPQIPSPPLPASPPILPIPLHAASPPLQLLSSDRRADRPEVTLPPRKRLGFVDSVEAEIRRRRAKDIGYGIRDTWIDLRDVAEEEALTTLEGSTLGQTEIFQRVEALVDDSQYHYETGRLVDQEARCSREAWAHSIGLSSAVHFELQGMKTVFCISNCLAENQIELKKKMADKYCPRNEMKKIETEFWNLEVQGTDSVAASKPKTMQEATEMATGLMDKKIRTYAERQAANKRKFKDTSRNNQGRQQPPKRQDVARAYTVGSSNRQQYAGSRPLCLKCNFNHDGPCTPRCYKCNKIGHLSRNCKSPTNANVANNQSGNKAGQKVTCYECGAQ